MTGKKLSRCSVRWNIFLVHDADRASGAEHCVYLSQIFFYIHMRVPYLFFFLTVDFPLSKVCRQKYIDNPMQYKTPQDQNDPSRIVPHLKMRRKLNKFFKIKMQVIFVPRVTLCLGVLCVLGRFVPQVVLSLGRFCLGRFLMGHFCMCIDKKDVVRVPFA